MISVYLLLDYMFCNFFSIYSFFLDKGVGKINIKVFLGYKRIRRKKK